MASESPTPQTKPLNSPNMLMETGPSCSADCRSASVVLPHFFPPTDFQPDKLPFVSAPFSVAQGEASHSSH